MQKLKIILVNLILFLILFHVVDFYCSIIDFHYNWFYKNYKGLKLVKYIKDYNLIHNYNMKFDEKDAQRYILSDEYSSVKERPSWEKYRPIENKNAKNSILIFGCSFAYGQTLNNQETFSYRLGQNLPNYAIYNIARNGWTTSHMLYQLENKNFSDIKNLKYVIYVFISDHIIRNRNHYSNVLVPYYKNTKYDFVKFQKYTLENMICPVTAFLKKKHRAKLEKQLYNNKITKELKYDMDLTKNIILLSKSILDYERKGKIFIILRYDRGKSEPYDYMFEELKKEGFIVLSVNNLSKTEYYNTIPYQISETDIHPNAKAWKEITPLFVKYMQDRGYFKD